jgi:hypothetical protein
VAQGCSATWVYRRHQLRLDCTSRERSAVVAPAPILRRVNSERNRREKTLQAANSTSIASCLAQFASKLGYPALGSAAFKFFIVGRRVEQAGKNASPHDSRRNRRSSTNSQLGFMVELRSPAAHWFLPTFKNCRAVSRPCRHCFQGFQACWCSVQRGQHPLEVAKEGPHLQRLVLGARSLNICRCHCAVHLPGERRKRGVTRAEPSRACEVCLE